MAKDEQLERNKAVVRKFLSELEAGRVEEAIALFASNATFWSPSTRKTYTLEEISQALHWVNTCLTAPMKYKLGPLTAEDNRVTLLAESFATTIEGKAYNNVYNFYFELEEGLITVGREYNDTAHVWATLRAGGQAPVK
jgi:ketosteroid isomerase-like protein